MSLGKFIVFEGLNGCGKETQLQKFFKYLSSSGKAVPIFKTGEPTELNNWGVKAREMLKSEGDPYENGLEAVKYFAQNRLEHNKIFRPLLEAGINVISDRYYYSNIAYQNAQGIPLEKITEANKKAIRPDITFILDTTPEESARRLRNRDGDQGRKFDLDLNFNKKVWKNYQVLGNLLPAIMDDRSINYINGMGNPEEIFEEILEKYNSKLM